MGIDDFGKLLKLIGDSGVPIVVTAVTLIFGFWVGVRWLPKVYDGIMSQLGLLIATVQEGNTKAHDDRVLHNEAVEKKIDEFAREILVDTKNTYKTIISDKDRIIAEKDCVILARNEENKDLYERLIAAAKGDKNEKPTS